MSWRARHPALAAMHLWGVAGVLAVAFCLAITPVYLTRIGGGASALGREVIDTTACQGRLGLTRTETALTLQPRVARACREALARPALRADGEAYPLEQPHARWGVRLPADARPREIALVDLERPGAAPAAVWILESSTPPEGSGDTTRQKGLIP